MAPRTIPMGTHRSEPLRRLWRTCGAAALLAIAGNASAAEGLYDASYGNEGRLIHSDFGALSSAVRSVVLADGYVVLAGTLRATGQIVVTRLRPDGSRDISFGTTGLGYTVLPLVAGGEFVRGIAVRGNGRIVVAGDNGDGSIVLVELTSGGASAVAGTFRFRSSAGVELPSWLEGMELLPDGKLLLAGAARVGTTNLDFAVARIRADLVGADFSFGIQGCYLEGFGFSGLQEDHAIDIALRGDGRFLVAGYTQNTSTLQSNALLLQFNANGTIDGDFGNFGAIYFTNGNRSVVSNAVIVDTQQRAVVGGWIETATSADLWLHRLLPDGSSDFGFGVGANAVVPFDLAGLASANFDTATTLVLDEEQRIVAVGEGVRNPIDRSSNVIAARFLPDGALDTRFGAEGKTVATFNPPAIISFDYGNTVGNVHVTPRGLLLTGANQGLPDDFGFPRHYMATLRLTGDPVLATNFESEPPP